MPWNDSGGPKDQDPWSGKNKQQGPPDLDKVIRELSQKFSRLLGGKKGVNFGSRGSGSASNPLFGMLAIVVLAIVVWALSGIFIVAPTEEAVVLQFGKYQDTVGPGPHWMPRFIQSVYKINTQTPYTFQLQSDFLTKSSDQADKPKSVVNVSAVAGSTAKLEESDIDKNVVYTELGIQYRIDNPKKYLFNIVNGSETLKQAAISVLSEVIGTMKLDQVLTTGRDSLRGDVLSRLRTLMASYHSGIDVFAVNVRKVQAPEEVADAFLEVAQAGQDGQRYQQRAEAYASKVVPLAQGQAARIKADAKAYQQKVIYGAKAAVSEYKALSVVYQQSPEITRERMYLDMMQSVLSHSSKVLLDTKGGNNMLYLPLDKMMSKLALPRELVNKPQESSDSLSTDISVSPKSSDTLADHYTSQRGY